MKIKIIWLMTASVLLIALIGGCKKDTYTDVPGACPVVESTIPVNLATNVPIAQVITVTFNKKMDPNSILASSFVLRGLSVVPGTLSYNEANATMSFVPTTTLAPNTTYTAKVVAPVRDFAGSALQTDYIWTFSTGDTLSPMVITTDPVNNATGVLLNKIVTATFSMPMDSLSINSTTVTIKNGIVPVNGTVTYSGTVATFSPTSTLASNTLYTATITTGAKNKSGIPLGGNYVWTFKTIDTLPPTVILTDPINNASGVVLNKQISAKFSVPMDPLSITTTTFTLKQGTTTIAGTVTYTDTTALFTPASSLASNTLYTATITNGVKNKAGISMTNNYTWKFTTLILVSPTVISTDPVNNATGVPLNKVESATFSVPMDPLTITTTTFTVKAGAVSVPGTVSYSGSTALFTPANPLAPSTLYTATITTGARNTLGTPLASNHVWTFTTVMLVSPTVISTDPVNNATGVPLNKVVGATFSVPMDPLTITTTTFTVKAGAVSVPGSVSYSGLTALFTPANPLASNTLYTASITTGARNTLGTPLASNYVWTFTTLALPPPTVISTDPVNNATGVALNKIVGATFSVPMDAATITTSTFTLKLGAAAVAGSVSYSGSTATFTPSANLQSGKTYTATITTGAKNQSGIALVSNYVWTFATKAPLGPQPPDLKSVARFGIIAGVGVSNNAGFSVINDMDVGISPGARSSITGFPPAIVVNGALYAADDAAPVPAMLIQAKADLTAAYLFAEGASTPAPATISGDQGGKTLAPGIYKTTSTLSIQSGDLTLDAQGDPNAVWIFQIASSFTTIGGAGGSVILSGGASAKNIYWQVGSSATIGDFTAFKGNIMALTSITLNSNATLVGRVLCINGAVVLTSTNTINKP